MPALVTAAIKDQLAADIQRISRERNATLELDGPVLVGVGASGARRPAGQDGADDVGRVMTTKVFDIVLDAPNDQRVLTLMEAFELREQGIPAIPISLDSKKPPSSGSAIKQSCRPTRRSSSSSAGSAATSAW